MGREETDDVHVMIIFWNGCENTKLKVLQPGGPLVFQGGYHPRKTTFKKYPKHVFFQVWKYTLNTYFLAFFLPLTSNSLED